MLKILAYNPDDRVSARQALRHSYFRELRHSEQAERRSAKAQELAESELLDDEDKSGRKGIKSGKSGGGKSMGKRAA